MEGSARRKVLWVAAAMVAGMTGAGHAGQVRAWGSDAKGQVASAPAGDNFVAVAAGDAHGLALRSDGTIVAWGQNNYGQCTVPPGIYAAIAAGADFSLAIRTGGRLVAWGRDSDGQVSHVPAGDDFVAVEGGESFAVALRQDSSLAAWGSDRWGQVSGMPKDKGFRAIGAGDCHAVALRSDGSLASWGYWAATTGMPRDRTLMAVSAGGNFCVALRNDGSLAWWGDDSGGYGVSRIPAGNDYLAVAAGYLHGLALQKNGSLVGWGAGMDSSGPPHWGQARPPAGRNYAAVACGLHFSLALTATAERDGPPGSSLRPVYRFSCPNRQWCFHTIDPGERDKLIRHSPELWTYEGPVFRAAETPSVPGLAPVYRFWSAAAGHFYTIDANEKDILIARYPHVWTFEGVAFYACPQDYPAPATKPVYRFRRLKDDSFLYTIDAEQARRLATPPSLTYAFEGVAYYAWE